MIEVAEAPVPGVNLAGYLDAELGLGEIARKFAGALELAQIPFAALPYAGTPSRRQHRLDLQTTTCAPFDVNIVCLNADEIHAFAADVGTDLFARRYSIGTCSKPTHATIPLKNRCCSLKVRTWSTTCRSNSLKSDCERIWWPIAPPSRA